MTDAEDIDDIPVSLLAAQNELEQHLASTELGFDVIIAEKLADRGIYDASRLKARKPEIYRAVRKCLCMCVSAKTTAELLCLDIRTVNQVKDELVEENAIPPFKTEVVARLRAIITIGLDELMERARKGELSAIDIAVLIDKQELLSGGVTSRSEVIYSTEDEADRAFYQQLRAQMERAEGMVLEAEVLPQRALADPAALLDEMPSQQTQPEPDQRPIKPPDGHA